MPSRYAPLYELSKTTLQKEWHLPQAAGSSAPRSKGLEIGCDWYGWCPIRRAGADYTGVELPTPRGVARNGRMFSLQESFRPERREKLRDDSVDLSIQTEYCTHD